MAGNVTDLFHAPVFEPLVSILLPVYNDARFLKRAVGSIQRQALKNWELLLLDDGSTDTTPDLVDSLCRPDPRIKGVHLSHRGISETLNAGLSMARGPFIARMDADDCSHPLRLALQKAWREERTDLCAVGCKVRIFPRYRVTPGMLAYEKWSNSLVKPGEIASDIFVEAPLVHPSVMIRREVLEDVGGYRSRGPEDYDLWLRLHRRGKRFGKVPRTLFWWMDRPRRATRMSPDYSRDAFRRCKAGHLAHWLGTDSRVMMVGNREAKRMASLLEEEGLRILGYVDIKPGRIDTCYRGVPVMGYERLAKEGPGGMLLAAVGTRGARSEIRRRLTGLGYRELVEFLCVG